MKNISSTLKSIGFIPLSVTIGFLVLVTVSYVYGWTEPAGSPPSNNTSAPVSVSSTSQYKSGALGIGGVLRGYSDVIGNRLCIGSDCRDAWPQVTATSQTTIPSGALPLYKREGTDRCNNKAIMCGLPSASGPNYETGVDWRISSSVATDMIWIHGRWYNFNGNYACLWVVCTE